MSNLRLFWEKDRSDAFPQDTNLYAVFPCGHTRLLGWVREMVEPEHAGFYALAAASLEGYFAAFTLDRHRRHATRAQAMRTLRSAAIVTWIGTPQDRREYFINVKGRI